MRRLLALVFTCVGSSQDGIFATLSLAFKFCLLLTLPLLLVGAAQVNVDTDSEVMLCVLEVQDTALTVANSPGLSCNGADASFGEIIDAAGVGSAAAGIKNFYVPANRRLVIDSIGVVVTAALAATEDCGIALQFDTTTAGAGSTATTINTGPGLAEPDCTVGSTIVDTVGESCTVNNFTTVIPGGGWWRVIWTDADAGGANTCTNWQGGTVWVRGRFSSQ